MNLKERKMIHRVYKAFDNVPGAHIGGGTMSVTVAGVANFGADIQEVRKHCLKALEALFDGAISTEDRDADFETHMSAAERFIESRQAANWKNR